MLMHVPPRLAAPSCREKDLPRLARSTEKNCTSNRECNRLRVHATVVQANASNAALYIMRHDVDLDNPICWLHKGPTGYSIPNLDQMVNPVRMVLQPFQLHFCSHTALSTTEAVHAPRAPVEYLQMNVRAPALLFWHAPHHVEPAVSHPNLFST